MQHPNHGAREHEHHETLRAEHKRLRDEGHERLREQELDATSGLINLLVSQLMTLTDEHEHDWQTYLKGGPRALRALEHATRTRAEQVQLLRTLLDQPREALLAHKGFVALRDELLSH